MANGDSGGEVKSAKTGQVVNINNRDVRVRPDTGEIEAVAGKAQFGREQDDWGNWFGNNNSNPLYHYALDERYLRRNPHVPTPDGKVNVPSVLGHAPVFPASRTVPRFNDHHTANRITSACSSIIYRDELFGPEFAGNSFVSEPVHNLVHREVLSPQGVSFTSRRAADEAKREFLASSDNWFRPTTIRVGPDGALWIADMYRETIEHPEWIPDEWEKRLDLRAGHDRGRIYRVTPAGISPRKTPRFDRLDAAQLVSLLESPGGTVRDMAQQRIIELADVSIVGDLEKMARSSKRATARLHALCTLDGLKQLTAPRASLVEACLSDAHPTVRRHALRLAEPLLAGSPSLERVCLRLCDDADMAVRQQVAYTLGECRSADATGALAQLIVENLGERLICAAAVSSLRADNVASVWSEIERRLGGEKRLPTELLEAFVATTVGVDPAGGWMPVADRISRSDDGRYADWQLAALVALVESLARKGQSLSEQLAKAPADSSQARQMRAMLENARKTATDSKADLNARLTAIRLLSADRDTPAAGIERLMGLLSRNEPPSVQSAAASILLRMRSPDLPGRLFKAWPDLSPAVRRQIVAQVAQRSDWVTLALDAVEQGQLAASDFDADNRWRLFDDAEPAIRERAERLLGAALDRNRQEVVARFKKLDHEGDASRGVAVFDKHCARCHRWGDRGQSIGPDLASIRDRLPETMLVAILDPNRAVEARYVSYTATTQEGLSYTGIITLESDTSITLALPDGKQQALLRSEIEELTSNGKSLMPEGLESELSQQDVADLLAMLEGSPDTR
jgi:putative heme-binding domain-containing protein